MTGSIFDGITSDSIANGLSSPLVQALAGMTQGFGQAAMPSRMPVPFASALGMGIGGLGQGLATGQALQKQGMANQFTRAQLGAMQQMYGNGAPGAAPGGGSATSGPMGMPVGGPGGQQPMIDPATAAQFAKLMAMNPDTAKAAGPWLDMMRSALPGPGTQIMSNGVVRNTPGALAADFATSAAKEGGTKAAGAPYVAPQEFTLPAIDGNGQPVLDASGNPTFTKQTMTIPQANAYVGRGQSAGGGAPASSASPSSDPFPGWASKINQGENGTGNPNAKNPASSATGNGQFIDQTWLNTIKATRPDLAAGKSDADLLALRSDPALSASATESYARSNGAFLAQNGLPVTGGSVALAHFLGPQGAARVMNSPSNTPVEAILPPAVMASNPQLKGQSAGQLVATYNSRMGGNPATAPSPAPTQASVPAPVQVAGPGAPTGTAPVLAPTAGAPTVAPGSVVPQGQMPGGAVRTSLPVTAPMVAPQSAAPGVPSGPAMTPAQTAALDVAKQNQIALNDAAASRTKLVTTRAGIVDPTQIDPATGMAKEIYRQPEYHELQDPNSGAEYPSFVQPGADGKLIISGGPPGMNGQTPPSKLGPGQEDTIKHLADEFGHEDKDRYEGAMNSLLQLDQQDANIDSLNKGGGWSATGSGAAFRGQWAKNINTAFQAAGATPPFDPSKVASWEDATKLQTQLAFAQAKQLGTREAASVVSMSRAATPGAENTPQGYQAVTAGLHEMSNREGDLYNFKNQWYQAHGGNLVGAESAFNNQFTPKMYADRAVSTVHPPSVEANGMDQFQTATKNYLPGTIVQVKNPDTGTVRTMAVPDRSGAPLTPGYVQKFVRPPPVNPNGG